MTTLHLLKVVVQPVFVVIDDDGNLSEQPTEPVAVPAAEWPTYPTKGFAQGFAALRQQVEGPAANGKPEHNGRVTKPPRERVPS